MNSSNSDSGRRVFWRSLEEKENPTRLHDEASGSDVVKQTIPVTELTRVNRRSFLTLSGAISTLAGIEGCVRRPVEKIMPYGDAPADVNVGVASHYATATVVRGEAVGLLVQSHEGRPTKIEGNPDHPSSLGSSDLTLGVRGARHPLRQFLRAGVPVVIATDDEGVARSDLTNEYQRAVEEQGLGYPEIKAISRNSLEFSFLPAAKKADLMRQLDAALAAFEAAHR